MFREPSVGLKWFPQTMRTLGRKKKLCHVDPKNGRGRDTSICVKERNESQGSVGKSAWGTSIRTKVQIHSTHVTGEWLGLPGYQPSSWLRERYN